MKKHRMKEWISVLPALPGSAPLRLCASICLLMSFSGCSSDPAKPNTWDRLGNSMKRGATAVRTGMGLLVHDFHLADITVDKSGTITARAIVFDNNTPVPSPQPLTIQTGVTK